MCKNILICGNFKNHVLQIEEKQKLLSYTRNNIFYRIWLDVYAESEDLTNQIICRFSHLNASTAHRHYITKQRIFMTLEQWET